MIDDQNLYFMEMHAPEFKDPVTCLFHRADNNRALGFVVPKDGKFYVFKEQAYAQPKLVGTKQDKNTACRLLKFACTHTVVQGGKT